MAIYGIKRNLNDSSPEWTRTDDAVGKVASASIAGIEGQNDFDNLAPFKDIITVNYDASKDKIVAKLGDDNFDFEGKNGDVMTVIPRHWVKRVQTETEEFIQISDTKQDGFTEITPYMVARYSGSGSTSAIYSKSNSTPFSAKKSRAEARTYAQAKGDDWGLLDWHIFDLQFLYLVEYANYNSQLMLGKGVTEAKSAVTSGNCDSLNMKSGCVTNDGVHSVIYRGIEDIFGNLSEIIDGIDINDYELFICEDYNKYTDGVFTGDYVKLNYNTVNNGIIKKFGYDSNYPLYMIPDEIVPVSGNEEKYVTDGVTVATTSTNKNTYIGMGENYDGGVLAGIFRTYSWYTTLKYNYTSIRLMVHHVPEPVYLHKVAIAGNTANSIYRSGKEMKSIYQNGTLLYKSHLKIVDFSSGTDAEIKAMLDAHYRGEINISDYWHVGDTRIMHLSEMPATPPYADESHIEQDITMVIIGIEHDELVTPINGNVKAAITLQCRELLSNNGTATAAYLWGTSTNTTNTDNYSNNPRRTWLNNTFINALPSTIQPMVKTVIKKNLANHTYGTAGPDTEDKAFLLSVSEMYGNTSVSYYSGDERYEGEKYPLYTDDSSRIKYSHRNDGSASATKDEHWLRSPARQTGFFFYIDTSGRASYFPTTTTEHLAPAFCL